MFVMVSGGGDNSAAGSFFPTPAEIGSLTGQLSGQGRWVALGTVAVCMFGAMGVALRPIYRKAFAGAAATQMAGEAAARNAAIRAGRGDPKVQAWVSRLRELQAQQLARNPMRAGRGSDYVAR